MQLFYIEICVKSSQIFAPHPEKQLFIMKLFHCLRDIFSFFPECSQHVEENVLWQVCSKYFVINLITF